MEKNKKILIAAVLVAIGLIIVIGILLAMMGRDKTQVKDYRLHLSVNGYTVEVPLSKDERVVDAPCLTTEHDNAFTLLGYPGGDVTVEGRSMSVGHTTRVKVDKLSTANKLKVQVKSGRDTRTIYFRTYSSRLPKLTVTGKAGGDGNYLVTEADRPVIYALNQDGEMIWYTALAKSSKTRFYDFREHKNDSGEVYYSYHRTDPDANTEGIKDYAPGYRITLDSHFAALSGDTGVWYYTKKDDDNTIDRDKAGDPIDAHGFEMLGANDTITLSYQLKRVSNIPAELSPGKNPTVVNAVVQEATRTQISWAWQSANVPELYSQSDSSNHFDSDTAQDYLHVNGMILDPTDQNVILSLANAQCLIKIERNTGKILWYLGGKNDGFSLRNNQRFGAVTDMQFAANGMLTVTSGDALYCYQLDETNRRVRRFRRIDQKGVIDGTKMSSRGDRYMLATADTITETNASTQKDGIIIKLNDGHQFAKVRYMADEDD